MLQNENKNKWQKKNAKLIIIIKILKCLNWENKQTNNFWMKKQNKNKNRLQLFWFDLAVNLFYISMPTLFCNNGQYFLVWTASPVAPHIGHVYILSIGQMIFSVESFKVCDV